MANPFYVEPTASKALVGVGSAIGDKLEANRAAQRMEQAQSELHQAMQGSPADVANFSIKYPELSQQAQQLFGFTNEQSSKAAKDAYARVLSTDNPEEAARILSEESDRVLEAGGKPTNMMRDAERLLQGGDLEQIKKGILFTQPDMLEAYKVVDSFDAQKSDAELKRLDLQSKVLNRQIQKETNELKKQELQLQLDENAKQKERKEQEFQVEGSQAAQGVDDAITVANELLSHKGLKSAVGASSLIPSLPGGEAANFEAKLEQFKSQQFLSNIEKMKGLGALSEAEGNKVAAAAGALDVKMSEEAIKKELETIITNLNKAKGFIQKKYGIKQEIEPTSATETPTSTEGLSPTASKYLTKKPVSPRMGRGNG